MTAPVRTPTAEQGKGRRIAYVVARILLGLILVANSPVGTLIPSPPSGPRGDALLEALWHTPYIMVLTKLIELSVGLLLLTNRFVALALVLFAPVAVNIVGFQAAFSPHVLPLGAVLVVLGGFIAWANRAAYGPLFRAKSSEATPKRAAAGAPEPSEARG